MDDNVSPFLTDEQIDLQAAWGIYRTFLHMGVRHRATIELMVFDEEDYAVPIVRADGKIYHTRFLAHRATPHYEQMTADDVNDFTHGVAELISTSKTLPHVGFVTFSLYEINDVELTFATQVVRWKVSNGILSMTGELPPIHKQQRHA